MRELFPPSPAPRPSGMARKIGKTRGPAKEYEEESEEEVKMGKWDYVGGRGVGKREVIRKITRPERDESKGNRYEPQHRNRERARAVTGAEEQNRSAGRRYSEREVEWERLKRHIP